MIAKRADQNNRSALKIWAAVIKEKGILQATFDYVVVKNAIFLKVAAKNLKSIKNWPKVEVKPLFSVKIWSEWQGSNLRHRHPKCRALPTAPHPDLFNFMLGFLQKFRNCGTLCGRKPIIAYFLKIWKRKNRSIKGFFEVSGILLELPISQSQTKRATNCATPR